MRKNQRFLGKWELGCIVFNSCIYKIFLTYPNRFEQISGSAGWLTSLFSGIIFILILSLILWFLKLTSNNQRLKKVAGFFQILFSIYWILATCYALIELSSVLRSVAFPNSPAWFLIIFFLAGSLVTALCGASAVFRMHSLLTLGIGISVLLIAVLGLKYAEPLYLFPILGKGADKVFGAGLQTLFLYSDSLLIFQLYSQSRPDIKPEKSIFWGAFLAVICNILIVLSSSMSHPSGIDSFYGLFIYPLAKSVYFGTFWSRLDGVYLCAMITSGFLYLSLSIYMIILSMKNFAKGFRRTRIGILLLILCLLLTGCYDGRQVEEGAYVIALGIDKGENNSYIYTFQLSNPLELGGKKSDNSQSQEKDQGNKTVSNISINAKNYYLATNDLKSGLSKTPDLSHLKIIAFSKDVAKEDLLNHASLLFREQEIRPNANLCLTNSAQSFLEEVKPTLEVSTARYYELMFRKENTPYAPQVTLREFVSKGTDSACDPVLPIANKEKLMGIGIFNNGTLALEGSQEDAMLYKLLSNQAKNIAIDAGDSTFSVTSKNFPKIQIDENSTPPRINLELNLSATLIYGSPGDIAPLSSSLESKANIFLNSALKNSCDIIGIGKKIRTTCLTDADWGNSDWHKVMSHYVVNCRIMTKLEKNLKILQF
ncbi:MAG: GerAB/ArcD/ProY family transporter [Clostridia bacterium]|nr:GerAB/ArcD/ProY family transporter [Clostridia bacterium]